MFYSFLKKLGGTRYGWISYHVGALPTCLVTMNHAIKINTKNGFSLHDNLH